MKKTTYLKKIISPGASHLFNIAVKGHFEKPFRVCVDITNRCNLECKTCYWRRDIKESELNDKEWESKIDKILRKNPSIIQGIWMGGEPLLRYDLIKKLAKKFVFNQVFTNGMLPIKPIPKTKYSVSIDGTKEFHERQRGKGYDIIKRNILNSKVQNFSIICLLSTINKDAIDKFVEEWTKVPNVQKIIFSFYNPNVNEESNLWIPFKERDEIIKSIQDLGKKFPKILNPARHLEVLLSRNQERTVQKCWKSLHNRDIHLDSTGNRKVVNQALDKGFNITCGTPNTDCYRCGADSLARTIYMSENRLEYLSRLFFSKFI